MGKHPPATVRAYGRGIVNLFANRKGEKWGISKLQGPTKEKAGKQNEE